MVLISVACARHVAEGHVRDSPLFTHVRLRLVADFASIVALTSAVENDQTASILA